MAKIVCITKSFTGMVNSSLEAAARLQRAGHQLIYACPWDIEDKVRGYGFEYHQLTPINFDPAPLLDDEKGIWNQLKTVLFSLGSIWERRESGVAALGMEQFSTFLAEANPDLLLIDLELHDYILTAVGERFPTMLLSSWYSIWPRPSLPPITYPIIPKQGWRGHQLGIAITWLIVKFKRSLVILHRRFRSGFADRRTILHLYAERVNFPRDELLGLIAFPDIAYRTLPVITMTTRDLEFPHHFRPNLHYVGPMVFRGRMTSSVDSQLLQLFSDRAVGKFKLIYCSITTMDKAGDAQFIERVMAAVSGRNDWRLIVAVGKLSDSYSFQNVPENVFLFNRVPQLNVLQNTDCSINHGGGHTINECIEFGVPMLIYSGKRFDQNGCSARVAYHGLGIMADKDMDTPQLIQRRIETILGDPSYRQKVGKVRDRAHQQRDYIVKVVDTFLEQHSKL